MFIKSNPTAFPHVMHFLLHNLDPAEFSSRFMWPLLDKTVEKEFRYVQDLKDQKLYVKPNTLLCFFSDKTV